MNKLLFNLLYGAGAYRLMDEAGENGEAGGAHAGDNGEVQGTNNDARVALLNSIGDGLDATRAEEMVEIDDSGTAKPFTAKTGEEGEDAEAKAAREAAEAETARLAAEQEAAAAEAASTQGAALPKIKVNGVEMDLTPELIEKAQKVAAADVYLATAAEKARQAEEAARQAALANGQPSGDAQDAAAKKVEEDLALARAIQMGSEAEAVAAIQKLRSTGPSPDDVSRVVDERLTFKSAIDKFNSDYKDIVGDPVLKKLAFDKDAELLAAGDTRSYAERYTAIGNELRAWVASKAPAASEASVQVGADKQTRKAEAPTTPKAAAGKQNHQQPAEKEETTQDIIADMAAKRGGPQWMMNATR